MLYAILHSGNGLITYGLGGFSYYYSRTRMSLSGTLVDHNQPRKVTGEAWTDHQWGNFLTLGGDGWDWFGIQLTSNTEMMLYLIRDSTGKIISSYIGYRRSPITGANCPSGWKVELIDPRVQTSLILSPELKNQVLVVRVM